MADHTTNCTHEINANPKQVCTHVYLGQSDQYYRVFNGEALEYDLVCDRCKKYVDRIKINMKKVCHSCFDKIEGDGEFLNYLGEPKINESPAELVFEHMRTSVPVVPGRMIRAIEPLNRAEGSKWLMVDSTTAVSILDIDSMSYMMLTFLDLSKVNFKGNISLKVSPNGQFAAITSRVTSVEGEKKGNRGVVINILTGEETMVLDRGDYYSDVSEFSLAFFEHQGKTLLVHASDWNRLDISDPATGKKLTERCFTTRPREAWRFKYNPGSEFFGSICLSPNYKRVADFGWCWGPHGSLSSWSLEDWLNINVWEADNGLSKVNLHNYSCYWDGSFCWIDDNRLCVWGIGEDDNLISGAVIFDATSGKQLSWFPGPGPRLFTFDKYLFTTELEGNTTSVWDINTGARLLEETSFTPHSYHYGCQQLLTALEDGSFFISTLKETDS